MKKRTELWRHFTYIHLIIDHERYYRCRHCGEIVTSHERRKHLRFKHPELLESR